MIEKIFKKFVAQKIDEMSDDELKAIVKQYMIIAIESMDAKQLKQIIVERIK